MSASRAWPTLTATLAWNILAGCSDGQAPPQLEVDAQASPQLDGSQDSGANDAGGCDGDAECAGAMDQVACAEASWCAETNLDVSRFALTSIWGVGSSNVWAVGSLGSVWHLDGSRWSQTSVGSGITLTSLWVSSEAGVWVGGDAQQVMHTAFDPDGGALGAWQLVPPFDVPPTTRSNPLQRETLLSLWGAGSQVYGQARLLTMNFDGSVTSLPLELRQLPGPTGSSADWKKLSIGRCPYGNFGLPSGIPSRALWGISPTDVWAIMGTCAFHGEGQASDAGGTTFSWEAIDTQSSTANLLGVWGANPSDIWVVGEGGRLRHWRGGKLMDIVSSPTKSTLHGVWGASSTDIWAVGDAGVILHYDGSMWARSITSLPVGVAPNLYAVWGSDAAHVWAVGEGIVLRLQEEAKQ